MNSLQQPDDFNWKFPSRCDTMYLAKCDNQQRHTAAERNSLNIDDIDGARPKYLMRKFLNKPSFINRNDDIDRSTTRQPRQPSSRKDNQLFTGDIDGAAPQYNKFVTTRHTNPLEPRYQLPVTKEVPPEIPKFIRDSIEIYDIEGSSTKQTFCMRLARDGKFIDKPEIQTKIVQKVLTKTQNFLDVRDINQTGKFESKRCTDPQEPIYQVMTEDNQKTVVGPIEKSKVPQPVKIVKPDYTYRNGDIEGSWPCNFQMKHQPSAGKEIPKEKITNFIADIGGAQVSTKKHGLVSKRVVNPLLPTYDYPGHTEPPVVKPTLHSRPRSAVQKLDSFIR